MADHELLIPHPYSSESKATLEAELAGLDGASITVAETPAETRAGFETATVALTPRLPPEWRDRADRLEWAQATSAGYDHYDLAAREEAGEWALDAVAAVTVSDVADAVLADHGVEHHSPEMVGRLRGVLVHAPAADAAAVVEFDGGRTFGVALGKTVTEGVVSSCGDAPGPKKGWRALAAARI